MSVCMYECARVRVRACVCARVSIGGWGAGMERGGMWLESYHLILFSFIEQSLLALLKVVPHGKVIPLLPDLLEQMCPGRTELAQPPPLTS